MKFSKNAFLLFFLTVCAGFSCKNFHQKLEEERLSQQLLQDRLVQLEEEEKLIGGVYAEVLNTLQDIDKTLLDITQRNRSMQRLVQQKIGTTDIDQQQQIMAQLMVLKEAQLEDAQKAKILAAQARKFRVENASIQKLLERADKKLSLTEQILSVANNHIDALEKSLDLLEQGIDSTNSKLSMTYADLKVQTNQLQRSNDALGVRLELLTQKNNFIENDAKAYLVCGTRKELRQAQILRLLSDKRLTINYQENVAAEGTSINYFEDSIIAYPGEKVLRLLPYRDIASYRILDNKIEIVNKKIFWSVFKTVVLVQN